VPAIQLKQVEALEVDWYWPAGQIEQLDEDEEEKVPAIQLVQLSAAARL